jgi:hypothetical protein
MMRRLGATKATTSPTTHTTQPTLQANSLEGGPFHGNHAVKPPAARSYNSTVVVCIVMLVVIMFLLSSDGANADAVTHHPSDGQPRVRFYGRWPTYTAHTVTARALSWVSRVLDIDPSVFMSADEVNRAPLVVPNSGKDWVTLCSHRGVADEVPVGAPANEQEAAAAAGAVAAAAEVAAEAEHKAAAAVSAKSIAQSLRTLNEQAGIRCADYDAFLSKDGVPFIGHAGIAATTLLGDGTSNIAPDQALVLLGNLTKDELSKMDPQGALMMPVAEVAIAMRAVLGNASTSVGAASDGVGSPVLFSIEPKGKVLGADAAAMQALSETVASDASCAKAVRQAVNSPTTITLAALQQCRTLTRQLRQGRYAQLLHRSAQQLRRAGIIIGHSTASGSWPVARFIVDVDAAVFSGLCALLPESCHAAHAPGNVGDNRIDTYFAKTAPLERLESEITLWIISELDAAMSEEATSHDTVKGHVGDVDASMFILPLRDRWLHHRATLAARLAKKVAAENALRRYGKSYTPAANSTAVQAAVDGAMAAAKRHECAILASAHASYSRDASPRSAPTRLPHWVSHLMPSTSYLKQCLAVQPSLFLEHKLLPSLHDMAAGTGKKKGNTIPEPPKKAGQGDDVAAAEHPVTGEDRRTYHCWVPDTEFEVREAVASLRCSHIVTNRPLQLAKKLGLAREAVPVVEIPPLVEETTPPPLEETTTPALKPLRVPAHAELAASGTVGLTSPLEDAATAASVGVLREESEATTTSAATAGEGLVVEAAVERAAPANTSNAPMMQDAAAV